MSPSERFNSSSDFRLAVDFMGLGLVLMSSILLGVWAVKSTIELRNILLFSGALYSIIYCICYFKNNPRVIPLKHWTPLFLLGLLLCWVVFHYVFLARFPEIQLHELTSTWLRSFMAMIMGFGAGLAITRNLHAIHFLWMGLIGSFTYLFYQYVPKALALDSLFAPDYHGYIFYGKISGVLAGTILVAGLLGALIDSAKRSTFFQIMMVGALWLVGTALALYSYVFIFDARNGVGLAVLIFCAAVFSLIWKFAKQSFAGVRPTKWTLLAVLLIGCSALMLGWFAKAQVTHNSGWSSMWEDTKIAIQIEKYPHWQNSHVMGYPQNAMGDVVKINNYERVAWATVGTTVFLPQNPFGVGVLSEPFQLLLRDKYPGSGRIPSTHSAWVEIALAFGYPGLLLMLGALIATFCISVSSPGAFQTTTGLLSLGLVLLYTVGEVSSKHPIEMLCFLIALMTALLMSEGLGRPSFNMSS
jgi:hypothetical protein